MDPTGDVRANWSASSEDGPLAGLLLTRLADIAYRIGFKALGNDHDARDISQEAIARLLALVRTRGLPPDVPEAWVSKVAMNLVCDHFGRLSKHPSLQLPSEDLMRSPDTGSGMDDDLAVVNGFSTLSVRQQEVLDHLYKSDLPVAAVAKILGISDDSVRTHRKRALSRLRTKPTAALGDETA